MADTYEKDLAQKSSLTTSDFIRVVGSDNVSYKQNVNDVNRTIPLTGTSGLSTEALIDQAYITAHTETPDRTPYRRVMSHGVNHSILGGGQYYLEGYKLDSSYGWQKITSYGNPTRVFTRSINNGTWTAWEKMPTRAEIDALTTKTYGTISSSHTLVANQCYLIKCGNMVTLTMGVTLTSAVSAYGTIATIPSGYRPDKQIWGQGINCSFDVTSSGSVRLISAKSSGQNLNITVTYVTA